MMNCVCLRAVLAACLLLASPWLFIAHGQNVAPAPHKIGEMVNAIADEELAYLDILAAALSKDDNLNGYIVGYGRHEAPPGQILRKVYGYLDYLVNKRGVLARRLNVITGEDKDRITTELWVAPKGATFRQRFVERRLELKGPLKFDEVLLGVGCLPEFTVNLYEIKDGLRFYAAALKENPSAKGWIIVHPSRRVSTKEVRGIAERTRRRLTEEFAVKGSRLFTKVVRRRQECAKAQMWMAPNGIIPPLATHNNAMQPTACSGAFMRKTPAMRRFAAAADGGR